MKLLCLLLLFSVIIDARRPRQISGKERGGVGIQLPSISIWPWSTVRQHRAATIIKNKPKPQVKKPVVKQNVPVKNIVHKNHQKPPPPISLRRKEATESNRLTPSAKPGFYKKPTGLEKKPFVGPKYPVKQVGSKFQKYPNFKQPPQKVRLAPIPDLRPTSIDRIDILRPQNLPQKQSLPSRQISTQPRANSQTGSGITRVNTQTGNGIQIVDTASKKIDSSRIINFTEAPVEVDGLQLFMFRGDEGIGSSGFKPIKIKTPKTTSDNVPNYNPKVILPQTQFVPSTSQFQWSQAEIKPVIGPLSGGSVNVNSTPRYHYNDVAPPFPTRHTTPTPNVTQKPIVIISQSNVAQN